MAEQIDLDAYLSQFETPEEASAQPPAQESVLGIDEYLSQFDDEPVTQDVVTSPLPEPTVPTSPRDRFLPEGGFLVPSLEERGEEFKQGEEFKREKEFAEQGIVTTEPFGSEDSVVFGLTNSLSSPQRASVLANIFKTDFREVDGEWQRKVRTEDGVRWALTNEDGLTHEDIAEFVAAEGLPFILGTGTAALAGAAAAPTGPGAVAAGIVGDLVGSYAGYVSNLLLLKQAKDIPDEVLPLSDILTEGPANEALVGMVGAIGIAATLKTVGTIYRLATGTKLDPAVVDRLKGALAEHKSVASTLVQSVEEATGVKIPLTVGQTSDDSLVQSLEHTFTQQSLVKKGEHDDDPLGLADTSESVVRASESFIRQKYGRGADRVSDIENLVRDKVKQTHLALQDSIVRQKVHIQNTFDKVKVRFGAAAPDTDAFATQLRDTVTETRDAISDAFAPQFTKLAETYGKIKGPNTHVADFKQGLAAKQNLLLEDALKASIQKFAAKEGVPGKPSDVVEFVDPSGKVIRAFSKDESADLARRASTPGAELSYKEVDTTLKAIRAQLREIRDHGKGTDSPSVQILKEAEAAYKRQRKELAEQAVDGGKQLADLDKAFSISKSQTDHHEVNAVMERAGGDFKLGGVELSNYLFSPKSSSLAASGDDTIRRFIPFMDKEPALRDSFDKAVKSKYSRTVKTQADHEKFMSEFEGAFKDIYGEAPTDIKAMGKLLEAVEQRNVKYLEAVEAMGADPLNKGSVAGMLKRISTERNSEELARLDSFMEDNPLLQNAYVATYLRRSLEGGERGFAGVIKRDPSGNRYIDPTALRKLIGAVEDRTADGGDLVDPIVRKYVSPEHREVLTDILEIAEMTNRGIAAGSTVKYSKSPWAHAIQLYLGPLTRGTRFSNTADVYMQSSAGKALINAMADPKQLEALLNKYKEPSALRRAVERHMYNIGARENVETWNDDTSTASPITFDLGEVRAGAGAGGAGASVVSPEDTSTPPTPTPASTEKSSPAAPESPQNNITKMNTDLGLQKQEGPGQSTGDALAATTDLNSLFAEAQKRGLLNNAG